MGTMPAADITDEITPKLKRVRKYIHPLEQAGNTGTRRQAVGKSQLYGPGMAALEATEHAPQPSPPILWHAGGTHKSLIQVGHLLL